MATFTLPTPAANYNGGEPAIGTEVRQDIDAIRTFIIGPNLDQDNFATLTGLVQFEITTNEQAINIQSEAEGIPEQTIRRLETIGVGNDPVDVDTPIFEIASGSSQGDRSDRAFEVSPEATSIAVLKTTAERDAISPVRRRMVIYNTDTERYEYYDGTQWKSMAAGNGPAITETAYQTGVNSTAPLVTVANVSALMERNGICSIALLGQGSAAASLEMSTVPGGSGGTVPAVNYRWVKSVDGGGEEFIHDFTWSDQHDGNSDALYEERRLKLPASILNFTDPDPNVAGENVDYRLQIGAAGAIGSLTATKLVLRED